MDRTSKLDTITAESIWLLTDRHMAYCVRQATRLQLAYFSIPPTNEAYFR